MTSIRSRLAPIIVISCAISSGPLAYAQFAPPKPPPAPVDHIAVNGIAAKVNGRIITENQVDFMLAPVFGNLAKQFPRRGPEFERQFKEAKDEIIRELINRKIAIDEFEKMGKVIDPNTIDDEIKRQVRKLFNGDEAEFREDLDRSRLTMEGYRKMTRDEMAIQAMRHQFPDAAPPLPDEIRDEYNEIKSSLRDMTKDVITFRKIFIPSSDPKNWEATPETQLELTKNIVRQINGGKDFEKMAKQYSKDAFAEQGGLLEGLSRTDLSAGVAAIIFDAPEGKVIDPLLDRHGFTIVKVISKILAPPPPLSEVRSTVEDRVRKKKNSAEYDRWIEVRRNRAMIQLVR